MGRHLLVPGMLLQRVQEPITMIVWEQRDNNPTAPSRRVIPVQDQSTWLAARRVIFELEAGRAWPT